MPLKNASTILGRVKASADGQRWSAYPKGDYTAPTTGLIFPANNAANSDIRFLLSGANLPARDGCTIMWASRSNSSITGYVTHCWFSHNVASFQADNYEVGGHPYPANSASVDGTGQTTDSGGSGGTTHYMEMAGLGARDQISNPGTAVLATKDGATFKRHALQATLINSNTQIRHRYWPDVIGDSTNYFERIVNVSGFPAPSSPVFYWGTSDWRSGSAGANTNDETPNGVLRAFCIVNSGALTNSQIAGVSACETDAAALSYLSGQSLSAWYLNMNPTPSDVADKSGNGRNPSWANALRPTLYTG